MLRILNVTPPFSYMDIALSNIAYAKGDYEKETEQDALLYEAMQ